MPSQKNIPWTTNEIREAFINFFRKEGHTVVKSAPLLLSDDPTLMFVNAGMVPFKDVFMGLEKRPYTMATSSQKCVRAGGKHNDLENVGYTARHHTFFEMLGNFSFGNYFKEHAIKMAWDFLTMELKIDPERLYVTVYHTDNEAAHIWEKVTGFSHEKIIRISTNDNFWSMGNTGPCGPCSEIFYDHGEHIQGGLPGTPLEDGDRYVEIWNLVFMQYNQNADGTRVDLPSPSIDTGAGLERLAAVMQGTHNNFETDQFKKIIQKSIEVTGAFQVEYITSHRIIADHLRSSCFLVADGVLPSNEGRGYVLRRIMRRAMRHAYILGTTEPLMYQLVQSLVDEMGGAYSELIRAQDLMTETLKLEEDRFRKTLGRGLKLLDEALEPLLPGEPLHGDMAFKLYDTYGFPLDLTEDILRSQNRSVDRDAFNKAMALQKAEARKSWSGSGDIKDEAVWFDLAQKLPETVFVGYENTSSSSTVIGLVQDGECRNTVSSGKAWIILDQTPFYAESGGQAADVGRLANDHFIGYVTDCSKKVGKFFAHLVEISEDSEPLSLGMPVDALVDDDKRRFTKANHSATHLLHGALRKNLGNQVAQKGSLVNAQRLRFDFSFNQAVTTQQLQTIEDEVNGIIRQNQKTITKIMIPDEALKTGAVALFGEKYGDEVRVISIGSSPTSETSPYSIEFCGGTHVNRTGDIGYFKIISETGISAGVRRIEALTGLRAEEHARSFECTIKDLSTLLKTQPLKINEKISSIIADKKLLEKEIKKLKEQAIIGANNKSGKPDFQILTTKTLGDLPYLAKTLKNSPPQELKPAVDALKKQLKSGIIVLGSDFGGKGSLVVGVTSDLSTHFSAVDLVRKGSEKIGGKGGGGRPDMAQAGGPNAADLDKAYKAIADLLMQ